jgi:hypothetical protein
VGEEKRVPGSSSLPDAEDNSERERERKRGSHEMEKRMQGADKDTEHRHGRKLYNVLIISRS